MQLALTDLFRARWTEAILDEWLRNLLEDRPDLDPERLRRTRDRMNEAVEDCLVTGYEHLVEGLSLPDPDDRHVLAAAIEGRVNVIVTKDLSDFPATVLHQYGLVAKHPDHFIVDLLNLNPAVVCEALRAQRA